MPNLSDQSIQQEIYILIAHYLKNGPLSQVGDILIKKIDELNIIPNRIDWTGAQHPKQYNELSHDLKLLPPDFILQSFNQLRLLLDKNLNNNLAKTNTLFGTGQYSLIQDVDLTIKKQLNLNVEVLPKDFYLKYRTNNRANFTYSSRFKNVGSNLVINLMKNQMIGSIDPLLLRQPEMLQSMNKHKRILGHLSAVYCVCFDRTGRYILTGADDNLIKIWCASDSRLLATLRGHEKEISDIDINYENTLVASGSCDKSIRVWNLRSTECTTVLQGHTSMVTSIEFSPMCRETSRWMASSGNDGIICFWSWDSKTLVFNPKPRKFIEKSKPGSQILCISFSAGGSFLAAGSNDHAIRVYFFDNNDPIKVWDQESHGALVDSIQFANNSARFLSGSKDGTAKIWKYESQKWKPLLIDVSKTLKKEEMDDTISLMDINKKHSVSMVTWNTDDTMVVTAQNNYLIKVWNSNDAKLIHELKGHTDEVFVLEANPRDPRLLLSAGHDGNVIIWNLFTGKQIKKFYNKIENEGHGCLFDTKWSPTSDMLASTDSHGYLSIFGFGSSEKYKRVPTELFFHTDYRPLMRDSNEFVVDEQTQQPPHLMQPPFLVNADGNPYDHEHQRLVPGRENLTDAQLNPLVIMNERGIPEIIVGNGDMEVDEPNATNQIRPRGTSYVKDLIRSLNPIELKTNEEKRISMLEVEEDYFIYEYRKYLEMSKTQSNQFDFKNKTSNFTRRGRKSSSNKNKPLNDTDNEENENISPRKLNHSEYDDETVDDQIIDIDEDSNTQHSIGAGAASSSNHATTSRSNYLQRRHNNDIDLPSASSDNSDYSDWAEQDGRKTAAATASKQPRTRSKQTAKRSTTSITTKKTLRILEDDDNAVDIDENTNNSFDSTPKTRKTNNSTRKKRILSDDDNDSNTQISVGASNHATTSNHATEAAATSTRKSYNNDYQSDSSNHSDYSDWADGRTKTSKHSTRKSKQTTKSTKSKKSLKILDEEENNNIYIDENTNHSFDSTPKTKKVTNKKNKKMITSDDDNDSTTQHSLNNNKSTNNSNNNSKYYVDDLDLDDETENDESSEYSDWAEEDGRKTLKPPPRSRKQQNKTSRSAVNSKRSLRSLDDEEINHNHIDIENENTNDSTSKTRKTKRMKKNQSEDEDEFNNSDDNEEDEDEYEEVDDDEYSSGHDEPCTSNSAYGRNASRMMSKTKKRKLKNKTKSNKSSNRNNSIHNFSNRFSKVNDTSTASSLNNKSVSFTSNKKRGKPPTKQQSNLIPIVYNECPVEYRPPEWLTSTRPKKSPYVPQMGDEIVYFRQGHELYANAVKMYKEYDLDEKSLPWHTHKLNVQEYCKVIGMKVEIRPPRLVCLKLRVIDPVSDKVTNTKFSIKFHDMAHVVDFVILRQIYDKAIEKDWRAKDKFRCIIDDVWWIGVIEAKKPFQDEYPDSNFQCLQITWDNGESEQLSPWDLEPLCGTNARKAKTAAASSACTSTSLNSANSGEGLPVTAEELKSMLYSDEEEWPGDGRDSECERILKGLQKIMELSIAEHFNYPVDLDAFPNYAMIIEYPIDLNTIRERLENRYYRRINSIQWDVRKIESNANRFNEPRSDIVRKAALLCELLLEFIGDPHCSNPIPIYKRLCQNKNLPVGEEANSTTTVINTPDSQYFNLRRNARSSHKTYVDENEDDEANDVYNDNDEYKSYNNKNSKKLNKKTSQNNSKHDTKMNNNNMPKKIPWLENCIKLIDDMIARDDAAPFISPVDLAQYPDYLSVVDTCIDLKTIKKRLNQNTYGENLDKFDADCKLLFQNSKSFNTNKRSKIYMMTLRLQSFYDGRIALIQQENESAIEQEAQYEKMTRKKHMERSRRLTNTRSNHELSVAASTSSFNNSHKISKIKLQNLNNSDLYDDQLNATNHFNGISTRSSSNKKTKSSTVDNFQTLIKNEHHQNSNHSQIESQNTSTASTSGATSSKYSQSNEMDNNNRSSSFMVDENNLENDSRITRERSLRERPRDRSRSQESILRNIVSNRLTMSKRSTVTAKS